MYAYIREKKAAHRGRPGSHSKEQVFSLVLRWLARKL